MTGFEYRTRTATRVFDLVDGFALQRGLDGAHPRPIGRVRLFLVADHTPGANQVFPTPPELLVTTSDSGYSVSFALVRAPDGGVTGWRFGAGPYLLRVRSDYYQVTDFDNVFLPATAAQPEPFQMVLAAAYTYPFPVAATAPSVEVGGTTSAALALLRGAVLAPDGTGIADATVTAPAAVPYRTDTDGQWVLVFTGGIPASGLVDVTITAPGTGPVVVPGVAVVAGGTATLPQTSVRGRVSAPGADPATVVVEVQGQPGRAGVRDDGVWAYYFPPTQAATTVTVTAQLPGRPEVTVPGVLVTARSTTTVPEISFSNETLTTAQRSTDA